MIEDKWVFILDAALAGQCALVITQLTLSGWQQPWRLPLMLLFISAFISQAVTLLQTNWFPDLAISFVFSVPALYLAVASLWIYTTIITSSEPMKSRPKMYWHLWPIPACMICIMPILFLPQEVQTNIALSDDLDDRYNSVVMPFLIILNLWVVWATPYLISVIRQLSRYRVKLRQVHSSIEHKALKWINVVVGLFSIFWLFTVLEVLGFFGIEILYPDSWDIIIDGLLVWTLALWGVHQSPGLSDVAVEDHITDESADVSRDTIKSGTSSHIEPKQATEKYRRSALNDEHTGRIAQKISRAMQDDKLYRDPNLSLGLLANHLGISTNYISQTLNTKIGESFFDHINRLRALDAEKALRETNHTVTQIAFDSGFNSRSAFYNAFNKRYGCAPAAYRKQHAI